jgi:hypothetical protein
MSVTAFGPQGPNYTLTRPPHDPKASAGIDTFFKNCSAAGAKDGTFATADFFNVTIANLRYLCRTAGVTLDDLDDTMLWQAVHNMVGGNAVITLTAPQVFYVNSTAGNDSNNGLTSATAFASLQKAADTMANWNLNGFSITVNVADGPYNKVVLPTMSGSGQVFWVGNAATPANTVITAVNDFCVVANGIAHNLNGFKIQQSGTIGGGIAAGASALLFVKNIEYGACTGPHNMAVYGATIRFDGLAFRITGGSTGNTFYPGCFAFGQAGSVFDTVGLSAPPLLTLVGAPNFATAFIYVSLLTTCTLVYAAISGTATGIRYRCETNSVINSGGGGASYYPGNAVGTVATGGQYI